MNDRGTVSNSALRDADPVRNSPWVSLALSSASVVLVVVGAFVYDLTLGTAMALLALGCGSFLARPSARGGLIARLPVFYVGAVGTLGMISGVVAQDILHRDDIPVGGWGAGYAVALWTALGTIYALPRMAPERLRSASAARETATAPMLVLLVLASITGIASVVRAVPPYFFDNPQLARGVIAQSLTPTDQVLYRCAGVVAILLAQYICVHVHSHMRMPLISGVCLLVMGAQAMYGGRLLALLTLLGVVVVVIGYAKRIPTVRLALGALAVFMISAIVAAYRYFTLFGRSLTIENVSVTALSQGGIEFLDGAYISEVGLIDSATAKGVFVSEIVGSVPSPIGRLLGFEAGSSMGFGAIISRALEQETVGGIRIGATGESILSYGFVGAAILGFILGSCAVALGRLEQRGGLGLALAACGSINVLSVLIVGIGTTIAASAVFALAWLATRDRAGRITPPTAMRTLEPRGAPAQVHSGRHTDAPRDEEPREHPEIFGWQGSRDRT